MDISIIIVNFKSRNYLTNCIKSIHKNTIAASYEILIVNNDIEKLTIPENNEQLKIIEHNKNTGFACACNLGAKYANGKILLFLNPDTEIISGNLDYLISAFSDQSIGIVSPRLLTDKKNIQEWSSGYNITLFEIILNNIGLIQSKELWQENATKKPDWVSGASLAIANDLFKKVGGFDENFFMYFEDVDLCKRITEIDLGIEIIPSIEILHLGGKSFSDSIMQKKLYYSSQDYYFKKHYPPLSLRTLQLLRNTVSLFKK